MSILILAYFANIQNIRLLLNKISHFIYMNLFEVLVKDIKPNERSHINYIFGSSIYR